MPDTNCIIVWDDGKGRQRPTKEPKKSEIVDLKFVENWEKVNLPGDYSFSCQIGSWEIEVLILVCPFCGFECPTPFLTKVESRDPLTLRDEMNCPKCATSFHIIQGKAIRSWYPGGIPCQKL